MHNANSAWRPAVPHDGTEHQLKGGSRFREMSMGGCFDLGLLTLLYFDWVA